MPERGGEGVVHIVSDRPDQFTDLAIAIIIHLIFPRSRPLIWRQASPPPHPPPRAPASVGRAGHRRSAATSRPAGPGPGWDGSAGGEGAGARGVHASAPSLGSRG